MSGDSPKISTSIRFFGALLLVLSVGISSSTIDSALLPRFIILAVFLTVAFLVFLLRSISGKYNVDLDKKSSGVLILFLGFFAISGISSMWAFSTPEAIFESLKFGLFTVLLFYLLLSLGSDGQLKLEIDYLVKVIISICLIFIFVGVYQSFSKADLVEDSIHLLIEIRSTLGNKNLFASALFLLLPLCFYGLNQSKRFWRYAALGTLNLVFLAILILQSRAVWLASLTGFFGVLFIILAVPASRSLWQEYSNINLKRIIKPLAFLLVLNAIVITGMIDSDVGGLIEDKGKELVYQENFDTGTLINNSEPGSFRARILLWNKSWSMFLDHPILGVGPGNWKLNIPEYGLGDLGPLSAAGIRHYQRPHNDFMWVLAETGVMGLVFYLGIFGAMLWYLIRILKRSQRREFKVLALLLCFGVFGYFVISLISFPKERIFHNVILVTYAALIYAMYCDTIEKKRDRLGKNILVPVLCLALLLLAVRVGYARINADTHAREVMIAHARQQWTKVMREAKMAESYWYNMEPTATPIAWYKGVAEFTLGNQELACIDFKRAMDIHPFHIHCLNNFATCYELNGEHQLAIDYYLKLLEISPRFSEGLVNLSAVYFNLGETVKAFETIAQCEPNSPSPEVKRFYLTITSQLIKEWADQPDNSVDRARLIAISEDDQKILALFAQGINSATKLRDHLHNASSESPTSSQ